MEQAWLGLRLLLLLAAANAAPIAAKRVFGSHAGARLDGGLVFIDGRPLLGASKTWRGLAASVFVTALAAPLLGFDIVDGALAGCFAMLGDALSSFCKRRLGIPASGQAFGLDQVPEALIPLLLLQPHLQLPASVVLGTTLAFLLLETPAAWVTYRLGLRDRPY